MASAYQRKDSPYWWINYKDISGKWKSKSTKYRIDNPLETKRARAEAAQATADELGDVEFKKGERWDEWVEAFLHTHCPHKATYKGYRQSWDWVRSYLAERGVAVPAQLTYTDAFDYVAWRAKRGANKGGSKLSTALRDLKVLRLIMRHAVRIGFATGNPCDRMGIERPAAKLKPELSDKQIMAIYKGLTNQPPWMKLAFSICLHTGCRISEANLERIDLDHLRKTLTFHNPKGGSKRAFTTILTAELQRIIEEATKEHSLADLTPPKTASQLFGKFFRKIKIKGVTIHCTRVTFISRLARSDVPERVARLAVNHSSEAVHRIYQRLRVDDLRQIENAVKFPIPKKTGTTQ